LHAFPRAITLRDDDTHSESLYFHISLLASRPTFPTAAKLSDNTVRVNKSQLIMITRARVFNVEGISRVALARETILINPVDFNFNND